MNLIRYIVKIYRPYRENKSVIAAEVTMVVYESNKRKALDVVENRYKDFVLISIENSFKYETKLLAL